jgi:hypothetical protein
MTKTHDTGEQGLEGEALLTALEADGRLFAFPAETAAVFRKDTKTVYLALERGEIPYVRIGQRYQISVAWMRRQVDGLDPPQAARRAGSAA